MAARHRTVIRLAHVTAGSAYGRAVLEQVPLEERSRAVPFPGLDAPASQLAVPLVSAGRLRGVLSVESEQPMRFSYDDEDALAALAAVAAGHLAPLETPAESAEPEAPPPHAPEGPELELRHYPEDDTVFLGGEYLITSPGAPGRSRPR